MASKRTQKKTTDISRGTETGAPAERPPIPDPLGDDRRVGASGELTSGEPGYQGLLRSGSTPLPDGGVKEHPTHDHGEGDDLDADGYEQEFEEARNSGFEPRDEEETPDDVETRTVPRRSAG
jgi:hypothetical protein